MNGGLKGEDNGDERHVKDEHLASGIGEHLVNGGLSGDGGVGEHLIDEGRLGHGGDEHLVNDERLGDGDRLRELHVDTLAPSGAARSGPP